MTTSDHYQANLETLADLAAAGLVDADDLERELRGWLAVSSLVRRRVRSRVVAGDLDGAVDVLRSFHDAFTEDDLP